MAGASVEGPLEAARIRREVERRLFGSAPALRVGRFEVGERIGAGGMSVVYEARDPDLDRRVALKLLQDGVRSERLLREARALAKLRHPNVVAVYEVGRWEGHVFLALEHVEGLPLGAWLARVPRSVAEVARVGVAIAEGLAAVHDLGLVHRDVKPDNVVIDAIGAPRLVDFGLVTDGEADGEALAMPERESEGGPLTRPGATPGTPAFIAPERRAGEAASAASDQFSFGVMLEDAVAKAAGADGPMRSKVREVARRARAERPEDRFPSMRDAAAALAAAVRPAGGLRLAALGTAAVAAATIAVVLSAGSSSGPDAATDPALPGDPPGYSELSVGTRDAEARRSVRIGLLALRDGARGDATTAFDAAVERDPSYGAAHLWRAILTSSGDVHRARASFERAYAARAGMSEPLRTLLTALVPCIQADPIDDLECERRLEDAAERSPGSAHLWFEAARHRLSRTGPSEEIVVLFDRARAADPGFAMAIFLQAQVLAYLGRLDEALAAADACLEAVPGSDGCMQDRIWIHAALGRCDEVGADARRVRAATPASPTAYWNLAAVAIGRGDPSSVVREHLAQANERAPAAMAARFRARDEIVLALLEGDFDAAAAAVPALEATMAGETDRAWRLVGPRARILAALESGDRDGAARMAADALVAMEAWAPDPRNEDFGIARDAEPFLLDVLRDTGAIDDAERARRRSAWLAAWRARAAPFTEGYLWLAAFARTADDATEAAEAISAWPADGPPAFHPLTFAEPGLGRVLFRSGRLDEAVPMLERAAGGCYASDFSFGLENGWESIRAARDLGLALEASGDVDGACRAYQRVLDRWDAATPRSVTAEDARARRAALGCDDTLSAGSPTTR